MTSTRRDKGILSKLKAKGIHIDSAEWNTEGRCTRLRLTAPKEGLPNELRELQALESFWMSANSVNQPTIPAAVLQLSHLRFLRMGHLKVTEIPLGISRLSKLETLDLGYCDIKDLPEELLSLKSLRELQLHENPLNPELAAAYEQGLAAVKNYLRAKADGLEVLNEGKLIVIGEGEVGKSCLLGALRGDPWEEGRPTTHGIEIKPVRVVDPGTGTEIMLNGWDFGGQRVYRPTHQLFFSAPAVYVVAWKPREGSQAGAVKEWIKLVKHREPHAKILVVATHGGPNERQPDIDRQEIWDLFGRETMVDFFHVESKPNGETQERYGIQDLKEAIARVAASLPATGRKVPRRWNGVRKILGEAGAAYLPLNRVIGICQDQKHGRVGGQGLLAHLSSTGATRLL
jgi:GTPase SAR1 family protein